MYLDDVIPLLLIVFIVCIIGFFGYIAYDSLFVSHPTYDALRKDEWYCTQEHTSSIPISQTVGKTTVITYMPTTQCVNYHRIGY